MKYSLLDPKHLVSVNINEPIYGKTSFVTWVPSLSLRFFIFKIKMLDQVISKDTSKPQVCLDVIETMKKNSSLEE